MLKRARQKHNVPSSSNNESNTQLEFFSNDDQQEVLDIISPIISLHADEPWYSRSGMQITAKCMFVPILGIKNPVPSIAQGKAFVSELIKKKPFQYLPCDKNPRFHPLQWYPGFERLR